MAPVPRMQTVFHIRGSRLDSADRIEVYRDERCRRGLRAYPSAIRISRVMSWLLTAPAVWRSDLLHLLAQNSV